MQQSLVESFYSSPTLKLVYEGVIKRQRVFPQDFLTLISQIKQVIAEVNEKKNIQQTNPPQKFMVTYKDDQDDWIDISSEDDWLSAIEYIQVLQSQCLKLNISLIQPAVVQQQQQQPAQVVEQQSQIDTEVQNTQASSRGFGRHGKKDKQKDSSHIPRKMMKHIIEKELKSQGEEIFNQMIKCRDLNRSMSNLNVQEDGMQINTDSHMNEQNQQPQDDQYEHKGFVCDGCEMNPIKGSRFKCIVCKDFDYCSMCEERLGHEHAFIKINKSEQAPKELITVLDEHDNKNENTENLAAFFGMNNTHGGHRGEGFRGRGRGGRGRGGRGGRGHHGHERPQRHHEQNQGQGHHGQNKFERYEHMFDNYMEQMIQQKCQQDAGKKDDKDIQKEKEEMKQNCEQLKDMAKMFMGQWKGGACGRGGFSKFKDTKEEWRMNKAIFVKTDKPAYTTYPGQTIFVEVEIKNDTDWAWKQGKYLCFSKDMSLPLLPFHFVKVPIDSEVAPRSIFKFKIPISVMTEFNPELLFKTHELKFNFYGKHGHQFGHDIPVKVTVEKPIDELVIYQMALRLHNEGLGSFDDCVSAIKQYNADEKEVRAYLKDLRELNDQMMA